MNAIDPSTIVPMPVSAFSNVVLPAPEGPIKAVNLAAPKEQDTPVSACRCFFPSPTIMLSFEVVISMHDL